MGFLSIFSNKTNQKGHILNEDDRKLAADINSLKWELKRKQLERDDEINRLRAERDKARLEAEIQEYQNRLPLDDEKDDELTGLLSLIAAAGVNAPSASGVSINSPSQNPLNPPEANILKLSDDEINGILESIPKNYLSIARKMPNEALRKLLEQKVGKVDDETFSKAINKLRTP